VRLWDTATGAELQTLKGHTASVTSVAFSPDSRQVVSGSGDRTARLWDTNTGAALQTLEGHFSPVSSVAFSPDGRQVVSRSVDRTVRLWDAATGAVLQTLDGYTDPVTSVTFSPDCKLSPILQVSEHWVLESDKKIICLPPDYRRYISASWHRNFIIGHSSGRISLFGFETAAQLVIYN
jgi:WD40 repeat protein